MPGEGMWAPTPALKGENRFILQAYNLALEGYILFGAGLLQRILHIVPGHDERTNSRRDFGRLLRLRHFSDGAMQKIPCQKLCAAAYSHQRRSRRAPFFGRFLPVTLGLHPAGVALFFILCLRTDNRWPRSLLPASPT